MSISVWIREEVGCEMLWGARPSISNQRGMRKIKMRREKGS